MAGAKIESPGRSQQGRGLEKKIQQVWYGKGGREKLERRQRCRQASQRAGPCESYNDLGLHTKTYERPQKSCKLENHMTRLVYLTYCRCSVGDG